MDPTASLLILLGVVFLIGVPALAIVAFVRAQRFEKEAASIPQLIARVCAIEQKLAALEKPPGTGTAAPVPVRATPPVPITIPPAPIATEPEPLPTPPIAAAPAQPLSESPSASFAFRTLASSETPSHRTGVNFETLIAGQWLNYVGILALLFAVAFFLKYAFENNWVGPRGRVAIGLLVGAALFPWSHRLLSRGYRYFSEGIAGLGAAVLYLSLWAGWHYYHVFPQSTAFALMIVVTAATATVAVGRNSERIAVLALVGGLLTPQLVSTGENHEVVLFSYLAVLGAGMLWLARERDWKTLPPIQFVGTLVYFWGWYGEFYSPEALGRTIFFATLFFLLFAALPVALSRREGELSILEAGIVLVNAGAYLIALRELLWPEHRWVLTLAVLALAAAHKGIERALPKKRGEGLRIARVLYAGLALTFATLVIPIRLDGKWITIAWAVEGAVLIWSGLRIRMTALRVAGFVLFLITAGRLALLPIPAERFLLNARFLTFTVCAAAFLAAFQSARRSDVELDGTEKNAYYVVAIAANLCFLVALSLDVWNAFSRMPSLGIDRSLAQELALSTLWLVYALGLIAAGVARKSPPLRWQALALLGVVIGKVFLVDLSFLDRLYRIVSFLLLGMVLMLISFYYQKRLTSKESGKE